MKTPCEISTEYFDSEGKRYERFTCPYSDDPTSETCRCYCALGVDEDSYPEEDYE